MMPRPACEVGAAALNIFHMQLDVQRCGEASYEGFDDIGLDRHMLH